MAKLRMGYVGCGFMAQRVHLPNLAGLDGCELVAIAEVRPALGRKVQAHFRIPKLYPGHAELAADREIDAVAVSGHFIGQGEIAEDLLRAGKDVFMEKPMAVSTEQADRLVAAERASGKRLMVGYMKRFDGGNLLVKRLIDGFRASGELGAVRYVRNHGFCGDWAAGLDTPFQTTDEPMPPGPALNLSWLPRERAAGYLGYLQQYTHNVNLVRWLLDAGDRAAVVAVSLDERDGMSGVVVLEVNGVRTVIESGGLSYHAWDEHTQVYFDKGWVRTQAPPLLLRNTPATVEVYRGDGGAHALTEYFPQTGWTWSYKEEMRHFIECTVSGSPYRAPASDARSDVRLLEEIYRRHAGVA